MRRSAWSEIERDIHQLLGSYTLWHLQSAKRCVWTPAHCAPWKRSRVKALSPRKKTQLKEANVLVERTYDALVEMWDQRATWGLENPVHGESRPELWQMPLMRQCPSWTTFDQAGSQKRGELAVHKLLRGCLARWPGLRAARGEVPTELDKDIVQEVRAAVLTVLGATEKARHRHRTTPAQTPRCWKPGATRRLPVDARLPGLEGWKFCTSRPRRKPTLLLQDYTSRGFCTVVGSATEAREMLGGDPVLNKLGVLVKEKVDAHGNKAGQGVDIRDAFVDVPAGRDRRFTAAAVPGNRNRAGRYRIVLFNTLVFGSASSPTIWGRMARLGRTARGSGGERLGPMSKATGGKDIEWVGARITCQDAEKAVVVTLPPAKVQALLHDTEKFLKKPVVGARELLAAFWAALSRHDVTNEGHPLKRARHLIHVKRVSPALRWVRALLSGGATSERIFYAAPPRTDLEILTDASPWGDGCCETPGWKTHRVLLYAHPRLRPLQVQSSEREAETQHPLGRPGPPGRIQVVASGLGPWIHFPGEVGQPWFLQGARQRQRESHRSQCAGPGRLRPSDPRLPGPLEHIPGVTNIQADALSRQFAPEAKSFPAELLDVPRFEVTFNADFWRVL
eukprot:s4235_g10.t2